MCGGVDTGSAPVDDTREVEICPKCGTPVDGTGYEEFGCWACGFPVDHSQGMGLGSGVFVIADKGMTPGISERIATATGGMAANMHEVKEAFRQANEAMSVFAAFARMEVASWPTPEPEPKSYRQSQAHQWANSWDHKVKRR